MDPIQFKIQFVSNVDDVYRRSYVQATCEDWDVDRVRPEGPISLDGIQVKNFTKMEQLDEYGDPQENWYIFFLENACDIERFKIGGIHLLCEETL